MEKFIKELEQKGYIRERENVVSKDEKLFIVEETIHFYKNGQKNSTFEIKDTNIKKCCQYCQNSFLKELFENEEPVIICYLDNHYVGYLGEEGIQECCENWKY